MPNPATGLGADVSKGLRKYTWALYLAPASGAAAIPGAKLLAQEPASPWVRQGRLKEDDFKWNIPDPKFLEGRAGFARTLKFRVVNEAEIPTLNVTFDEADPEVQARLRGTQPATSLSSGAYTGYQFIYQTGLFYSAKVLFVGSSQNDAKEKHIFAGNSVVTFKHSEDPTNESLEATITFLNDSSNFAFTMNEWA